MRPKNAWPKINLPLRSSFCHFFVEKTVIPFKMHVPNFGVVQCKDFVGSGVDIAMDTANCSTCIAASSGFQFKCFRRSLPRITCKPNTNGRRRRLFTRIKNARVFTVLLSTPTSHYKKVIKNLFLVAFFLLQ